MSQQTAVFCHRLIFGAIRLAIISSVAYITMSENHIRTARGPVEAEISGRGPPILVLHGSPGGIDGARAMGQFLEADGFSCIYLSRPGYLKTPLHTDTSIDAEADTIAALLESLDMPRVGVLAWSGGGPSAYRLAVRHPDRIPSMVIIAGVSASWVAPKAHISERFMFGTRLGEHIIKFIISRSPEHIAEAALEGEGTIAGEELRALIKHVVSDPPQLQLINDIAMTMNIGGERKLGWQNDVANFANIKTLELELVSCPVLLVHGDADSDALPVYSHYAHAVIPQSELIIMPGGTHLSFYAHQQARNVQGMAMRWFDRYK